MRHLFHFKATEWRRANRAARFAADPILRAALLDVAASIVDVLQVRPGIGARQLRASVRALRGRCADAHTDAALKLLGAAVRVNTGRRGDKHFTVDPRLAPIAVRIQLASRIPGVQSAAIGGNCTPANGENGA